jgi:hypothetical protein
MRASRRAPPGARRAARVGDVRRGGPELGWHVGRRAAGSRRSRLGEYDTGERELYDLTTDPAELRNVVSEADPAQLARFHHELLALEGCAGASCRRADTPTPDP